MEMNCKNCNQPKENHFTGIEHQWYFICPTALFAEAPTRCQFKGITGEKCERLREHPYHSLKQNASWAMNNHAFFAQQSKEPEMEITDEEIEEIYTESPPWIKSGLGNFRLGFRAAEARLKK